jgi:hypothetical protein
VREAVRPRSHAGRRTQTSIVERPCTSRAPARPGRPTSAMSAMRPRAHRARRARIWCKAATMSTPTLLSPAPAPGQPGPRGRQVPACLLSARRSRAASRRPELRVAPAQGRPTTMLAPPSSPKDSCAARGLERKRAIVRTRSAGAFRLSGGERPARSLPTLLTSHCGARPRRKADASSGCRA